jgi:hypothetical protein
MVGMEASRQSSGIELAMGSLRFCDFPREIRDEIYLLYVTLDGGYVFN